MFIDKNCSSSMVYINQEFKSIKKIETDMCVSGGLSLMMQPETLIMESKTNILSLDESCKKIDCTDIGYCWSKFCEIIILKTPSAAIRDE